MAMQPANFLNVNYSMSTLEVKEFLEAERNGDPKAVQEFAGLETGKGTRDIHFRTLGFTATTTEFAHLKFRFNVTDTVRMAKKVLDAAMHYIGSMRSDHDSWYKLQECYALTDQAKACLLYTSDAADE